MEEKFTLSEKEMNTPIEQLPYNEYDILKYCASRFGSSYARVESNNLIKRNGWDKDYYIHIQDGNGQTIWVCNHEGDSPAQIIDYINEELMEMDI